MLFYLDEPYIVEIYTGFDKATTNGTGAISFATLSNTCSQY